MGRQEASVEGGVLSQPDSGMSVGVSGACASQNDHLRSLTCNHTQSI